MTVSGLLVGLFAIIALAASATCLYLWRQNRGLYGHDGKQAKLAQLVLAHFDDVAWLYDIKAKQHIYVSPSIERQRGWKPAEVLGDSTHKMAPLLGDGKVQQLVEEFEKRKQAGQPVPPAARHEIEVPIKSGGKLPVETEFKLIADASGNAVYVLGVSRDITERHHLEKTLREAEERVRLALHCSGDAVWDANLQTQEMVYVDGWEAVLGYSHADIEPTLDGYKRLVHVDDLPKLQVEMERHISGETPAFQCEFRMRTKDGGWRWILTRGKLWSHSADGKPLRVIGTHTDITSRKVAEVAMSRTNVKLHSQIDEIRMLQTRLAEQAVRDPLTSLYNRRYLDETLEREVARARREGHPLSVVMLDVDHFKKLNDSYGHQAGDEVLKALADLLREDTRAEDVACRYGGEEFLVLLPSMPLDRARDRAEHWRKQLEQHVFGFGNFSLSVTASFGVSGYPHHGKTPDDLTRAADSALYSAKRLGRNRVAMYDDEPIVFLTGNSQNNGGG